MATPILSQPQTITQFDLARFVSLSAQIESLKSEHAALERQLTASLDSGALVEPGNHTAKLRTTERRWYCQVNGLKAEWVS